MNELKRCVERANINPERLNQEGKEDLASDIVYEFTEEELNKFLKEWGYSR